MTSLVGRKVMVVEDLYYLAMDVKAALAKAGAQVVGPFPNGKAALHRLADGALDCAILDVNLGEGASYDLARTLRSRGVPFLFFTGYDPGAIPAEFADVRRLEKPVDAARLLQAVANCLPARAPGQVIAPIPDG